MRIKGFITEPKLWGLTKASMRDAGRAAIGAAGLLWHREFKKLHFQLEAFSRYGYRFRAKKWEAIKAKRHPESGGRPLVFTGESESLAMYQSRVDARATSFDRYHADVTVSAPKLNFHANEMTKTTPEEDDAMAEEFARVFGEQLMAAAEAGGATSRQLSLLEGGIAANLAA